MSPLKFAPFLTMLVFILSVILPAVGAQNFKYEELVALKNCHPFDSCMAEKPITQIELRNCRCDRLCSVYGDCCLDSAYALDLNADLNQRDEFSCVGPQGFNHVYMKNTCGNGWTDSEIMDLCLQAGFDKASGVVDPVASLPVTSSITNATYANYYCAICNGDSRNITLWEAGWECEGIPSRDNISLVLKDNVWGTYIDVQGNKKFTRCMLYPVVSKALIDIVRSCIPTISSCSPEWTNEEVRELCHSYTAVVYGSSLDYRNVHCAMCNFLNPNNISCNEDFSKVKPRLNHPSFAALFDFHDSTQSIFVGSKSTCKETEIWDPFFKKCRDVVCGKPNQVFSVSRCVDVGDFNHDMIINATVKPSPSEYPELKPKGIPIVFPSAEDQSEVARKTPATEGTSRVSDDYDITEESRMCNQVFLDTSEILFYPNGTVFVQQYNRTYSPGEYEPEGSGILVCAPPITTNKFPPAMKWVSLAGALASCACLMMHLIAFLIVPDLRNLSGRNLASLCLALLIAYISFIVNLFLNPDRIGCVVLASVLYFSFLSAFCWMNTSAFDIWYTFKLTQTQLRVSTGSHWAKFIAYSIYSWILPAIAVVIVVSINELEPDTIPKDFLPNLGANWCWFGHRKALLVFFALPITVMVILNGFFFISTACIIAETTTATSNSTTSSHHKNQYKMHLRLAVLMGFTWLSGTIAGYLQVQALYYIFVILNTLQGVFIFLSFTCRRRVWRTLSVTSSKWIQSGSSWLYHIIGGKGGQNIELRNSPSTSLDGL